MTASIVIPSRFNGPVGSGNGGYVSGAIAAHFEGAVEVTLRRPVPLERPLDLVVEGDSGRVLDGEELIAEARPADLDLDVPEPVGVERARTAMAGYEGLDDGPFCSCFVCGRAREDGFGVFAGPLGEGQVASTWVPEPALADAAGNVPAEFVWAVMDCPTYFAAYAGSPGSVAFLGRMTGRVDAPVRAGVEHVVSGWSIAVDGRKRLAGATIASAEGEILARAKVLLIEPRPE